MLSTQQQGRSLLRALRSGTPERERSPKTHEDIPAAEIATVSDAVKAGDLKPVPSTSAVSGRLAQQIQRVQQISVPDSVIDEVLPEADFVPEGMPSLPAPSLSAVEDSFIGGISEGCCATEPSRSRHSSSLTFFGIDRKAAARQMKKQAAKLKRQARRASRPFVAYYEPEDVDDYDMPILLVANEEETIPRPEAQASGLLSRRLADIKPTLDYAWGKVALDHLPDDFHQKLDNGPYVERYAPRKVVQWAPTNLWYYPLYFEDPQLERYGHTRRCWIQPFVSSGRFMVQTVGLPYQMTLHPPHCREYALGYYQPGEWAPKKTYQIPWNEEAAATEFLWIMGFVLLVP